MFFFRVRVSFNVSLMARVFSFLVRKMDNILDFVMKFHDNKITSWQRRGSLADGKKYLP